MQTLYIFSLNLQADDKANRTESMTSIGSGSKKSDEAATAEGELGQGKKHQDLVQWYSCCQVVTRCYLTTWVVTRCDLQC